MTFIFSKYKKGLSRFLLVLFGLFLFHVAAEVGLRLSGYLYLKNRRLDVSANEKNVNSKSERIRILCLGESTTAGQWPTYLAEYLSDFGVEVPVDVIDKGVPSIKSYWIAEHLPLYLDEYSPDIVIGMIGVNDEIRYLEDVAVQNGQQKQFFIRLRIVKLYRLLAVHIGERLKDVFEKNDSLTEFPVLNKLEVEKSGVDHYHRLSQQYIRAANDAAAMNILQFLADTYEDEILKGHLSHYILIDLAGVLFRSQKYIESKEWLKKILLSDEINPEVLFGKYQVSQIIGDFTEAVKYLQQALLRIDECKDENERLILQLEDAIMRESRDDILRLSSEMSSQVDAFCSERGRLALDYVNKVMEFDYDAPDLDSTLRVLSLSNQLRIYSFLPKFLDNLIRHHKNADQIKDKYMFGYITNCFSGGLYTCFCFKTGISVFEKLVEYFPNDAGNLIYLAKLYFREGQYEKISPVFEKALSINRYLENIPFAEVIKTFHEEGLDAAKKRQFEIKTSLETEYERNYKGIVKDVLNRDVPFVAVQYPLRKLNNLKNVLGDFKDENVYYVDNEISFRACVDENSFEKVFCDSFAGDFGHCTKLGNRLLAQNIAREVSRIIKEDVVAA